ncbi:MAG: hypothetical protein DID92_2727745250 [Candidatus Nitrotoga sp. SPKER]|nr:MAG: hypothetical protein DID92_2727745250 [Candidatus Nitrotoga sp. SPKER]
MAALIVGGDKVTTIRNELFGRGIVDIEHWNGRKPGEQSRVIPKNTELIVVVTNFINHSLAEKIKKEAKRLNLPVMYSKNSRPFFSSIQ